MGCFSSGGDQPSYNPPQIKLPTAQESYTSANNFWNQNYPGLMSAQTNALNNANDPNYYSKWQPTSFEQAMGNQYFQNVWPDTQAYMKNQLAQTGMINTPGAAAALGKEYGNLQTGIGQYLADQGNSRATNALNAGLGISTSGLLNPFASMDQSQALNQGNINTNLYNAQYQNQLQQYMQQQQQSQAMGGMIGGGIGGALALGAAPFTGGASLALLGPAMSMGSQLGTGAGGGTMNPMALAMSAGQIGSGMGGMNFGMPGGSVSPQALQGFGGGMSNSWNNAGGVGRAESVYPNFSFS